MTPFEYKDIGSAPRTSTLVFNSVRSIKRVTFYKPGTYIARIQYGPASVPEYFNKVFTGRGFLQIQDEKGVTYMEIRPRGYEVVNVYRHGDAGVFIHWT